jgi:ABC-type transport system involved in multi-copper enzyme maturation permease subunit
MDQTTGIRFLKPRWHAARILQNRHSQAAFWGLGIFITITAALLASALVLNNSIRFAERNTVLVSMHPLFLPVFIFAGVMSLYLAIVASVASSREYDKGTLEVLLYGPVDETSFLFGIFLAQLKVYLIGIFILFVWANLVTWFLNLAFSVGLYLAGLTSVVMAATVIAFGLFTAVLGGKTRTALVYFILTVLLLGGLQIADQIVTGLVLATTPSRNDPILLIRNLLASSATMVQWISPYSQYSLSLDAITSNSAGAYLRSFAIMLFQMFLLLFGSIALLRRKGVRGV